MRQIALLTIAFLGSCFAQALPPDTVLQGRVISDAGGPLGGAAIAVTGSNPVAAGSAPPTYNITSNANGDFAIHAVQPNSYRIFVYHTSYLEFVYAQPDGNVVIPIAAGEHKNIELKMTPQSSISGRITDADGEPVRGAGVSVLRVNRQNGTRQLIALSPIATRSDGTFSISNLSAGRYYLAASSPTGHSAGGNNTGDERYVTTYFPASLDVATASPIDIAPGAEIRNMDIRLRKTGVFHIQGKTVSESGATVPTGMLRLRVPGVNDPVGGMNRVSVVNGTFAFQGLLPGAYVLQAWSAAHDLQANLVVNITDHDVEDVVLTLAAGLEIPLTVRIDDADDQQAQTIRSALGRFPLTASDGLNDNAMAQSKGDGTWIFHNIGPGTYRMSLGGPAGSYVKSIRYGNQDITTRLLDTTFGGGALELVLSAHAAEVSGVVQDANGQPLSAITVTLWTPGLPAPGTLDQARSTGTDALGRFRFANLRPGEYRVAAWEKIEPGLGNISEFHFSFDASATTVKVSEDSHETIQPVLIGHDKVVAAAAKLP